MTESQEKDEIRAKKVTGRAGKGDPVFVISKESVLSNMGLRQKNSTKRLLFQKSSKNAESTDYTIQEETSSIIVGLPHTEIGSSAMVLWDVSCSANLNRVRVNGSARACKRKTTTTVANEEKDRKQKWSDAESLTREEINKCSTVEYTYAYTASHGKKDTLIIWRHMVK